MDIHFYEGHANNYSVELLSDGIAIDTSIITKLSFKYSNGEVNSVDNPSLFYFDGTSVKVYFGRSLIPSGTYYMRIIVYTSEYPDGYVWEDDVKIRIEP